MVRLFRSMDLGQFWFRWLLCRCGRAYLWFSLPEYRAQLLWNMAAVWWCRNCNTCRYICRRYSIIRSVCPAFAEKSKFNQIGQYVHRIQTERLYRTIGATLTGIVGALPLGVGMCLIMAGSNVVCGGKSKFAAHFFISPNRDQMLRENPIELCIGMC